MVAVVGIEIRRAGKTVVKTLFKRIVGLAGKKGYKEGPKARYQVTVRGDSTASNLRCLANSGTPGHRRPLLG